MAKVVIQATDSPKNSRVDINNNFTELYEGANIIAAAEATTPADADILSLIVGGVLKKLSWANLKATLKTYFDTLYPPKDGWISSGETWTYSSVDNPTGVLTVPSNATTKYSPGMRIKFVNGGNTIYGIITAVTSTTITFLHEINPATSTALTLVANSAITSPFYSTQKAPFGFPLDTGKWTVELSDTAQRAQTTPTQNEWYNIGSLSLSVPIGCWNMLYSVILDIADTGTQTGTMEVTLSTANNSESNTETKGVIYMATASGTLQLFSQVTKSWVLSTASKSVRYLNGRTTDAGVSHIRFRGDRGNTIIRAVLAYL